MHSKKPKAFTLVELLVVIAIIALLMSILMPVVRKARNHAMKVYCANNIKQVLLALNIYALEYNDYYPQHAVGTGWLWLWNIDTKAADYILKHGATVDTFFCPANTQQKRFRKEYWEDWYLSVNKEWRILGYFCLWDNAPPNNRGWQPQGSGNKRFPVKITDPKSAETEIFTDVTMSNERGEYASNPKFPYGNFVKCGGAMVDFGTYDCSNHVINENKCEGGNIGFVDGHVDWRPFAEMERRSHPESLYTHWW
jgi:prepilin-type N-terminal cleavage/methylation domain-containing protein/prepilin-type processing-associated H-X9-DG protein